MHFPAAPHIVKPRISPTAKAYQRVSLPQPTWLNRGNQNHYKKVYLCRIFNKMASKTFENEFLKNLELLSKEQQNRVITYVKALLKRTKSNNQQALLQFAGSFKSKDVQEISSAIEAGCENIDKNEW